MMQPVISRLQYIKKKYTLNYVGLKHFILIATDMLQTDDAKRCTAHRPICYIM